MKGSASRSSRLAGHPVDGYGRQGENAFIDPITCECCPTAATVTRRGPGWCAWSPSLGRESVSTFEPPSTVVGGSRVLKPMTTRRSRSAHDRLGDLFDIFRDLDRPPTRHTPRSGATERLQRARTMALRARSEAEVIVRQHRTASERRLGLWRSILRGGNTDF